MFKKIKMPFVAALLVFGTSAANADVIAFENAWDTSVDQGPAWCTSCGDTWRVFDTFTLTSSATITQIDAELAFIGTTQVNYSIWTADRTTELFSQTIAFGDLTIDGGGQGTLNNFVSAAISGLWLGAGTYALSIWDMEATTTMGWHAALDTVDGSNIQCINPSDTQNDCFARDGDQAFRLIAVPEPGTLALFGMGLLGLGLAGRKSKAGAA